MSAWLIVGVLLVGILVYGCAKNELVKSIVLTIVCIALPLSAGYCGVQLNTYYNAEGGVFGYLSELYNPNKIETVNNMEFKVSCIELKQASSTDSVYKAIITKNEVFRLGHNKKYVVTVNDLPCDSVKVVDDGVIANYSYNFYNEQYEFLLNDSLTISIGMYNTHTQFIFQTSGGGEAVKNWNAYFNTHDFVLKIEEGTYEKDYNLSFGDGDVSGLDETITVTYCVDNEVVETKQYLVSNDRVGVDVVVPDKLYCEFAGWSIDEKTVLSPSYVLTEDVTLHAMYKEVPGFYNYDGELMFTWNEILANGFYAVNNGELKIGTGIGYYYDWELDDGSTVQMWESYYGDLVIDDSVTVVKSLDSDLRRVLMPNSVVTLYSTFQDNEELEFVRLSKNLQTVYSGAFGDCPNLKHIFIPASVNEMMNQIFLGCNIVVYCEATEKPPLWDNTWAEVWPSNGDSITVKWGYTYEQYLAEIGR